MQVRTGVRPVARAITSSHRVAKRSRSSPIRSAFEYLETTETKRLYGAPSDTLAEMLRVYAEPGVPLTSMPVHQVGFTRASVR